MHLSSLYRSSCCHFSDFDLRVSPTKYVRRLWDREWRWSDLGVVVRFEREQQYPEVFGRFFPTVCKLDNAPPPPPILSPSHFPTAASPQTQPWYDSSSTSDDAYGILYLTVRQGDFSRIAVREINPLDVGNLLGNIGGFWGASQRERGEISTQKMCNILCEGRGWEYYYYYYYYPNTA